MKSTISARAARAMTLLFIRSAASCARQSPTVFSPAHVIEKLAHILARQARRLGNLDRRHGSVVLPEDCQDLLTRCSQRPCHNLTPISPLQPLEMRCQLIGQCHAKQPLELDSCDQPASQAWLIGKDRAVMLDFDPEGEISPDMLGQVRIVCGDSQGDVGCVK